MFPLLARALGAFYLIGGILVLRALAMSRFMEMALAALNGVSQKRALLRSVLLAIGGILTAISGLALFLLHDAAIPLMLANVAMQIVWLLVAGQWFPPEDEDDRRGRLSTMRATAMFAGVTLMVLWLERTGKLAFSFDPTASMALALSGLGLLGWQAYAINKERHSDLPTFEPVAPADYPDDVVVHALPARIHIEPRFYSYAIWDAESGQTLDPEGLDLPPALAQRIIDFGLEAGRVFDDAQPGGSKIGDLVARAQLEKEAQAIVAELIPLVGEDNVTWCVPEDDEDWKTMHI